MVQVSKVKILNTYQKYYALNVQKFNF